jgi:hypothetical protein
MMGKALGMAIKCPFLYDCISGMFFHYSKLVQIEYILD